MFEAVAGKRGVAAPGDEKYGQAIGAGTVQSLEPGFVESGAVEPLGANATAILRFFALWARSEALRA